jgi:hypothetical protein
MFIAPLDGNHERGGDAILANESKWVLIEFKRDKNSISDEIEKFTSYPDAKKELEPHDAHHILIYGEPNNNSIILQCQSYFSAKVTTVDKVLQSGTDKDHFINYLNKFVEFKNSSKGSVGGYGFVAGVSSDGTVTKCMKLSEFAEVLQLEAELTQKLQQQKRTQQRDSSPGIGR